nr:hypothetical protein [Tanacetum cinerariifolium]
MANLKFADTHNMVAFLSKPTECDGFEQIVDFLNAHPIRKPKRKDTQVPQPSDPIENVPNEAIHKEFSDSLVRDVTTTSSLEAKQDNDNINKTQSKETPNESSSQGTNSVGGPRCQETMGVLDLEKTMTTQLNEIASLKMRVKKLKKKNRSRTHRLKRLYKVGLTTRVESSGNEESLDEDASKQEMTDAINTDEEITLEVFVAKNEVVVKGVNDEVNVVKEVVEVINTAKLIIDAAQDSATGDIVSAAGDTFSTAIITIVSTISVAITVSVATKITAIITTVDDITLAQALEEIKSTKYKEKWIDIQG